MSDHTITNSLRLILSSIDKYVDHEFKIGDFIYGLLNFGNTCFSALFSISSIKDNYESFLKI
jgi:hypothetical protein